MFKKRSLEEKKAFAKQFSKKEVDSYRKGKRLGFLEGVHKGSKKLAVTRKYTKEQLDSLFDKVEDIKI